MTAFPEVAAAAKFNDGSGKKATLTGSQLSAERIQIFFGSSGQAICQTATLSGTLEPPSETVSFLPAFGTCTVFGAAGTVSTNGCAFIFRAEGEGGSGLFLGSVKVSCPAGKSIVVSSPTCELEIKGVENLKRLEMINELAGDLEVRFLLGGVPYTVTKDGTGCPLPGLGSFKDGSTNGRYTITATSEGAPTTLFVE